MGDYHTSLNLQVFSVAEVESASGEVAESETGGGNRSGGCGDHTGEI